MDNYLNQFREMVSLRGLTDHTLKIYWSLHSSTSCLTSNRWLWLPSCIPQGCALVNSATSAMLTSAGPTCGFIFRTPRTDPPVLPSFPKMPFLSLPCTGGSSENLWAGCSRNSTTRTGPLILSIFSGTSMTRNSGLDGAPAPSRPPIKNFSKLTFLKAVEINCYYSTRITITQF